MNEMNKIVCPVCGREFTRDEMEFTYDCNGIPFRLVCFECWDKIMRQPSARAYDGAYYTELDENIWDY